MHLTEQSKIYFIGIGGIAMSATAGIAKQMGFEVSGSDSKELYYPAKGVLTDEHIPYHIGYDANHVKNFSNTIFVASAGEDERNPEIAELRKNNVHIYSLSEMLRELFSDKLRIVVTGTHGKSTTTAMLGKALSEIDNSSFMTGAVLTDLNKNFHVGDGHYAVFEGDEYKALYDDPTPKFIQYEPDILLLTNLEFDHPDMFESLEDIKNELALLIHRMPDDGVIVYNSDNAELVKLVHESNLGSISFALDTDSDFTATEIQTTNDYTKFLVKRRGDFPSEEYKITAFGRINVYNALGPIALLRTLGFSIEQVQSGLDNYEGIKRRFEYIGQHSSGAKVFDDYAHHPTAVKETLATARLRFPDSKIWAIFEPHTFSRTEAVINEISESFIDANEVLISEIYPARERKTETSITGETVVKHISKHTPNVKLIQNKEEALQILNAELSKNDVVIIMAVGDFNTLAQKLTNTYAA
ncbi:TPA: UDP-N-acetylmuramate--L-alanine ligase [Patescibacteria group bacterium]|jgi:UDP-N-acetylmuramate--alanine ligase|nr:UDP-N-acetylmuramate--L-alanine ligase [Patescibacteria group bacterium]